MGRLKKMIGAFLHAPDRFDLLAQRIADNNERLVDVQRAAYAVEGSFAEITSADRDNVRQFVKQLMDDPEMMREFRRAMCETPLIRGEASRLRVSPKAAMDSCVFDTLSGEITVGDDTMAGLEVRLLTESRNLDLTGLPRLDVGVLQGCDIHVGKGVFLESGCTLLGPCTVGDYAVIRAGSVVVPGTEIPAWSVWSGNPAKEIARVDPENQEARNRAARVCALEENGGALFLEGWSRKIQGVWNEPAHLLFDGTGRIAVSRASWIIRYQKEFYHRCELRLEGPAGICTAELTESEGELRLEFPVPEAGYHEVKIFFPTEEQLMISLSPWEKEDAPRKEKQGEETGG